MGTLFYWALGLAIVLLIISGVLLLISAHKKKKSAMAAFARVGAELTDRIGDLWLDENHSMWLIARESDNIPVHRYDQVRCAELAENGIQYLWIDGAVRSAEENTPWPIEEKENDGGLFGSKKQIITIYLNIFTDNIDYPVETLVLFAHNSSRSSQAYRDVAARATALMRFFNTLQENN